LNDLLISYPWGGLYSARREALKALRMLGDPPCYHVVDVCDRHCHAPYQSRQFMETAQAGIGKKMKTWTLPTAEILK